MELNRQVLKDITTPKRFLRHFGLLLGIADFNRESPDFHAGDKIIYDGHAQGVLLSDPILTGFLSFQYALCWIALGRINNETGYFYVQLMKLKKRGRSTCSFPTYNNLPVYCGERIKRISVTSNNKTDKYVFTYNDLYISLYYNRILKQQFWKHHHVSARSLVLENIYKNYWGELYGDPKPEIKKGDRLKVFYDFEHEDYRTETCFAAGEPIPNIFNEWVVPCFLYDKGMTFVNAEDVKVL